MSEINKKQPYAYAVYFPDQPKVELVHDLDELTDDLTNREHVITALYAGAQQEAQEPVQEVEFDGYKGQHNVRWYINELKRIMIVNQWLADGYCNKLRDLLTAAYRQHSRDERGAELMANNAIADLANRVKKLADSYWLPGADIPDLAQFERTHDEVTKRLLSGLTAHQPAPAPLSDDVVKDAARYRLLRDNWFTMYSGYERCITFKFGEPRWSDITEEELDAAIDAALAAQGGK